MDMAGTEVLRQLISKGETQAPFGTSPPGVHPLQVQSSAGIATIHSDEIVLIDFEMRRPVIYLPAFLL